MDFWLDLLSNTLATFIGAGLGVWGALWLSGREKRNEVLKEKAEELERRGKVLSIIEVELTKNYYELIRPFPGDYEKSILYTYLKDESWRALSEGGEIECITDPQMLDKISHAYYCIRSVQKVSELYANLTMKGAKFASPFHINALSKQFTESVASAIHYINDILELEDNQDTNEQESIVVE